MVKDVKKNVSKKPVSKKARAKKATTKLVDEKIDEIANDKLEDKFTPDMFFKIFFEGWKRCFDLEGRTSRLELWVFIIMNTLISVIIQLQCGYILSSRFLVAANEMGFSIDKIESYICWASFFYGVSIIVPLIAIGAMMIRRMHDLGRAAWHGYVEQIFMGVVVLSLLVVAIDSLSNTDYAYTILAMGVCFVTIFYSVLYYCLKFLGTTLYYKGDEKKNEFGNPNFVGRYYDDLALKFGNFYILFILTIAMLYLGVWYF